MTTNSDRAAAIPPISALPYPLAGMSTTWAPSRRAISCEPSVLPLSATTTSPSIPRSFMHCCALATQVANVSDSLRHGSTTLRPEVCSVSEVGTTSTFFTAMTGQFYEPPACCGHCRPLGSPLRAHGFVRVVVPADSRGICVDALARVVDELRARDAAVRAVGCRRPALRGAG